MKKLTVEIADTHIRREYGLMDRKSLDADRGMLFKFPYANRLGFWMKNTYIPLDIAFIDEGGSIFQIEKMAPLSTKGIFSKKPCQYALEVNRNWFSDNGIKEGDKISIERFRTAQASVEMGAATFTPNNPQAAPQQPQATPQTQVKPEIKITEDIKTILQNAKPGQKFTMIYYDDDLGVDLPPKVISAPTATSGFEFKEGKETELVVVFDESAEIEVPGEKPRGPRPKTFKIENIRNLEPLAGKEPVETEIDNKPLRSY